MLRSVITKEKKIIDCNISTKHNWIILTDPTPAELLLVSDEFNLELDFLKASLDVEESSRIENQDNALMMIINASIEEDEEEIGLYDIIPLGIIIVDNHIITISKEPIRTIENELKRKFTNIEINKETRFTLQIINDIAQYYLSDLKRIDRKTSEIEKNISFATNKEILNLLEVEKTLVHFRVNLSANAKILKRASRLDFLKKYEEDDELLQDAQTEFEQAIEMAQINTGIIQSIREAIGSMSNNRLNETMKTLAIITVIFSIPTSIFSFFGMNVPLGIGSDPFAVLYIVFASLILCSIFFIVFKRKD